MASGAAAAAALDTQRSERRVWLVKVFSVGATGGVAAEGWVDRKGDLSAAPEDANNRDYMQKVRQRTMAANVQHKSRQLQVIDDKHGALMRPLPTANLFAGSAAVRARASGRKPSDDKRERMERKSLEDLIFSLFERQPHWSFKQMTDETQQPAVYLKEVLQDLAVYNKRGPHQGLYEVKPEYRAHNKAEVKPPG
eukprot:jgi/Chlat1/597/Chrsp103S01025